MRLISLDYETIELTDTGPVASTEAYRPNFRVDSCALAFDDGSPSEFIKGEDAILSRLTTLQDAALIVHNVQFESMVTQCRFPSLSLNWHADTMRLAQQFDNGGDDSAFEYIVDEEEILEDGDMPTVYRKPISGLGLVVCSKRILGLADSHKDEAYSWLHENVAGSKGKEGRHLHALPPEILARYNIADAEITMQLYKHITEYFRSIVFDWTFDYRLFMSTVNHIVDSKIRGVVVDRELLATNTAIVRAEVKTIEQAFLNKYAPDMTAIEYQRAITWILAPKTASGKRKRLATYYIGTNKAMVKALKFNTGSNKQLAELFVGRLEITPQFFTDKGAPSFKSAMLNQWGEGGEMLKTRRKRMLVLSQMESLEELSRSDTKFHMDLKACGTSTGRMAGGRS